MSVVRRRASRAALRVVAGTVALAAAVLLAPAAARADDVRSDDLLVPNDLPPPPTAEEIEAARALAGGAPAVVLLDFFESSARERGRLVRLRRLLVLDAAGAAQHADFAERFYGEVRLDKAKARTLLPDGRDVDCTDAIRVKSGDLDGEISLAFPQVVPGAVLDVRFEVKGVAPAPLWRVQGTLPEREIRVVVARMVAGGMRPLYVRIPADQQQPVLARRGGGAIVAWTFRDVPGLPDVPNAPPLLERARLLVLAPAMAEDAAGGGGEAWSAWAERRAFWWSRWTHEPHAQVRRLARETAGTLSDPREIADAVRRALAERVSVQGSTSWPTSPSPDQALADGRASSGSVAGMASVMLDALGIRSVPHALRLRGTGALPAEQPVPALLNQVVLQVRPRDGEPFWLAPASTVPAGTLPADCQGVLAIALEKGVEGPTWLPDLAPDANATRRRVQGDVAADGSLHARVEVELTGPTAHAARRALEHATPVEQQATVQGWLTGRMPSARASDVVLGGLADEGAPLLVAFNLVADGAAQVAGNRMVMPLSPFARVDAEDWSAETRDVAVDLGRPSLEEDVLVLRLPEDATDVRLPAGQVADGGPAGRYELTITGKGRLLQVTRRLSLRQTRYPASAWAGLRDWFLVMARADDERLVLTTGGQP